jgi:transposase
LHKRFFNRHDGGIKMNAVGIDVSKGKSTVAILRPFGEIVASPFEVTHTGSELGRLADLLKSLRGETKVIMECTGGYHRPVAHVLREAGLFVSAVHAKLIHDFGNNSIRKVKTDKADSLKIAAYGLSDWLALPEYVPEDDVRRMLKTFSRQYAKYGKVKTMLKNNLISLLDQTFPGVNELFSSPPRQSDGHQKWVDFAAAFWHCECVCGLTRKAFAERYKKWCKRAGYNFSVAKADDIYAKSRDRIAVMPKTKSVKLLIAAAVAQTSAVAESMSAVTREMKRLASELPEYPVVSAFYGVGDILGPQLMAEIGNVGRFPKKGSLVCFAGFDVPPFQSGKFESVSGNISKKGSPHLRRVLFRVMECLLEKSPPEDPVYRFLDRKRAEGKHYRSYMSAGSAKFLRIYYARVKEYLNKIDSES